MILYTTRWRQLDIPFTLMSDTIADSISPVEYTFQNGEVKLRFDSQKVIRDAEKFVRDEEWDLLPENKSVPYCLQITGIESMKFSYYSGHCHPVLFVNGIEKTSTGLRIDGSIGEFIFSGRELTYTFLIQS